MRKKDCSWLLKWRLGEADEGELEVVSVSFGFPNAFPAALLDDFSCEGEFNGRLCEPQRYLSQPEKLFCHASDTRKLLNTMCSEKGIMQQQRNLTLLRDDIIQVAEAIFGHRPTQSPTL